jgi:hypothetical protein
MTLASIQIEDRELSTVLAALRYLQSNLDDALPQFDDSGYFDDHPPLNESEIDSLCERLNLSEPQTQEALVDLDPALREMGALALIMHLSILYKGRVEEEVNLKRRKDWLLMAAELRALHDKWYRRQQVA